MIDFIDKNRDKIGVGPICNVLPIAPSTYYEMKSREKDPSKVSDRYHRDEALKSEIQRVWSQNFCVYGARKVWKQLNREHHKVARCTLQRFMRNLGLRGIIRGKGVRTTIPDNNAERSSDLVNREFRASRPDRLWVADFTYSATWKGFVYAAFVIDVFSKMIVGWRVFRFMKSDLTLDALDQATFAKSPGNDLIHHSDRGSQYLSIEYSERISDTGINLSVGSVGDSYDNAMAETINGLFRAEVIWRRDPWRSIEDVESVTLKWVDWFNNRRIMEPLGDIPPKEFEMMYDESLKRRALAAGLK